MFRLLGEGATDKTDGMGIAAADEPAGNGEARDSSMAAAQENDEAKPAEKKTAA